MIHVTDSNVKNYGDFQSYTNQPLLNTASAQAVTYDTLGDARNIYLTNSSRVTASYAGEYNLQFSVQLYKPISGTDATVFIWLRQNGQDLVGSTGQTTIQKGHVNIVGWNYYVKLNAKDYVELMWSSTESTTVIQTSASSTSPVKPGTAGVVMTLTEI